MSEQKRTILELFEQNELDISRLYRLYSQNIQGHKRFWEKLSREEIGHSIEITRIGREEGFDMIKENNFSHGIVKYVSDFVEEQIERIKKEKVSHKDAVETVLRIEQSMLEKKCFEIFVPSQESLKKVLKKLNKETEKHVEVLNKELKKVQNR